MKVEKADNRSMSELFPSEPYPILQILSDVNKVTNFVSCFEHYNVKHAKQKPKDEIFFGGIMGYGFDLGTNRIAKISKGLNGGISLIRVKRYGLGSKTFDLLVLNLKNIYYLFLS